MARTDATITIPMPRLLVRLELPRAYGLRMWVTTKLIGLAARIAPHDIDVTIVETAGRAPEGRGHLFGNCFPDRRP